MTFGHLEYRYSPSNKSPYHGPRRSKTPPKRLLGIRQEEAERTRRTTAQQMVQTAISSLSKSFKQAGAPFNGGYFAPGVPVAAKWEQMRGAVHTMRTSLNEFSTAVMDARAEGLATVDYSALSDATSNLFGKLGSLEEKMKRIQTSERQRMDWILRILEPLQQSPTSLSTTTLPLQIVTLFEGCSSAVDHALTQ